jgi:hypothetical protein
VLRVVVNVSLAATGARLVSITVMVIDSLADSTGVPLSVAVKVTG